MNSNEEIKQILKKLNLEKLAIVETTTIYCFPKENNKEFQQKFKKAEDDLKKITKSVTLKLVEEGEIEHVKRIEFSTESGSNGTS